MTNDELNPNDEARSRRFRHSCFVIHSSFVIRASSFALALALLPCTLPAADHLGILGAKPRWHVLEHYQETITRAEFTHLLYDVYCTHGFTDDLFKIDNDSVRILLNRDAQKFFTLRFAPDEESREHVPRLWRPAKSLPPARIDQPLSGLRIALDPGHLGGEWAKMEERWFQVGDSKPVTEGDLTLKVARILAPRLRSLGAKVFFVRNRTEPVTPMRPNDFVDLARRILIKNGVPRPRDEALNPKDPEKEGTIRFQSEILFYRYSEIRRRAVRVNTKIHPDVVLCLHFNAEGWGDPANPTLIDTNHLHLLVNGSYLKDELDFDDERFEMVRRLLSRAYDEELPLSDTVATAMAKETGLSPFQYPTTLTTTKIGTSGYVYARNLLANRLYRCPVVYCEPYVMNSKDAFARIQAGDYEGTRKSAVEIDNGAGGSRATKTGEPERVDEPGGESINVEHKSIFREYVDGLTNGLVEYYWNARK